MNVNAQEAKLMINKFKIAAECPAEWYIKISQLFKTDGLVLVGEREEATVQHFFKKLEYPLLFLTLQAYRIIEHNK